MPVRNNPEKSHTTQKVLNQGSLVIYLGAATWYLAFIIRSGFPVGDSIFFSLFDDAMISMRYARNMADGYGLVWNNGEYIEGYTNFLWTVWMAVLHMLPVPESKISLVVACSGAIILLINVHVIRKIAMEFTRNPWVILPAMALVAFNFGLIYWTLRGMEVGIIALFLNGTVLLALRLYRTFTGRKFLLLLGIMGLMLLTRTDCLVPVVVTGAWLVLTVPPGRRRMVTIFFLGTLLLFMGGHTLFRVLYYHDPLPNTYYLKVSGTPASVRILRGLEVYFAWLTAFFIPVVIISATALLTRWKTLTDKRLLLLIAPFLFMSAYSVYVGGDAWEWMPYANRYITVSVPLVLLFTVMALKSIVTSKVPIRSLLIASGTFAVLWFGYMVFFLRPAGTALSGFYPTVIWLWSILQYPAGLLLLVLLILTGILYFRIGDDRKAKVFAPGVMLTTLIMVFLCLEGLSYVHWGRFNALHVIDDRRMVRTGLKIQSLTTPETSIAVVWGGAIPYFSHRYSVDLMGKMDRTIAKSDSRLKEFFPGHTKWNYGFSITTYHPDLVLQLFYKTPADDQDIESLGYDHIRDDLFIRKGSYRNLLVPYGQENQQKLYDLIIQK